MLEMMKFEDLAQTLARVVVEKEDFKLMLVYDDIDRYEVCVYKQGILSVQAVLADKRGIPMAMLLFGLTPADLRYTQSDTYIDQICAFFDARGMQEMKLATLDSLQVNLYD